MFTDYDRDIRSYWSDLLIQEAAASPDPFIASNLPSTNDQWYRFIGNNSSHHTFSVQEHDKNLSQRLLRGSTILDFCRQLTQNSSNDLTVIQYAFNCYSLLASAGSKKGFVEFVVPHNSRNTITKWEHFHGRILLRLHRRHLEALTRCLRSRDLINFWNNIFLLRDKCEHDAPRVIERANRVFSAEDREAARNHVSSACDVPSSPIAREYMRKTVNSDEIMSANELSKLILSTGEVPPKIRSMIYDLIVQNVVCAQDSQIPETRERVFVENLAQSFDIHDSYTAADVHAHLPTRNREDISSFDPYWEPTPLSYRRRRTS